jgi:hypothetical protein
MEMFFVQSPDSYSFIEQLAQTLLLSRYSDQAVMVMLHSAFFDASGHPNQHKVMTVAGYAASVEQWKSFEKRWREILKKYGVTAFHMTDFASSGGEFVGWKGPAHSKRRKDFTEELSLCIEQNVSKAFRASVIVDDYNAVDKIYRLSEKLGRPYAACGLMCIFNFDMWAKINGLDTLQCFFEDGDKDKGSLEKKAQQIWAKTPQLLPVFLPKQRAIQFEAADFAGWKFRNSLTNALAADHTLEKGKRLLESVAALRRVSAQAGVMDRNALTKFCEIYSIARRPTKP